MKILVGKRFNTSGGSLVVTLVICSVLAFSVLGYLSVVEQQGTLGRRSQSWNVAMAVAEAGIEEGLQHLNANWNNMTRDGWTVSGTLYVKSNTLPEGNSYTIAIAYGSQPIIVSKSYVNGVAVLASSGQGPIFATGGNELPIESTISRGVRVRAYRSGWGAKALAAKNTIDMNGNDVYTDSFDSEDPAKSNNGIYDPSRAGDNGDVASNASLTNSVDVGNANIYGHVSTGPGGAVTVGDNGGVGSHLYQSATTGTMQDGWVTDDSNFTFPDTTIPYTSGLTPDSGDIVETSIFVVSNSMTSATHPGMPGVQTNITSTTTSSAYPSPPPYGLTTNVLTITSSTYPSSSESPVRTNFVGTVTSTTYPNPAPAGVITNVIVQNSGSLPSPIPSTITTNTAWKDKASQYPAPGTYVGQVTTNGTKFSYLEITGYSWTYQSYTYNKYTYTYTAYTYNIPTAYTYSYDLYTTNTVYTTNHYDNILYSGKYYVDTLSGKTIVLGQAELVAGNGISMSGSDVIKIKPGGSLTNWVDGSSVAILGNGLVNETGLAKNFICLCSTNVTDVNIGGNGEFTGMFVAPNGNLTLHGGGREIFDFIGSVMVNTVRLNGNYAFHYDEALGRLPAAGRYLIGSWDEIPVKQLDSPSVTAL